MESGDLEQLTKEIPRLNEIFEQSRNYSHIYARYTYSSLIQILYRNLDSTDMPDDIERIFSCSFIHEIEEIVFAVLARLQTEQHAASPSRKHVIPVSYTHLDVYKRQLHGSVPDDVFHIYRNALDICHQRILIDSGYVHQAAVEVIPASHYAEQ